MLTIKLENSTACNAACHFCPHPDLTERMGLSMPMDLFKKIVDEAVTSEAITSYTVGGLGEPLLDPLLDERISYIHARTAFPISIYTNGVALNPKRFERLKEAGLSNMVVSLNAVSGNQHERIMRLRGKFEMVLGNIRYALANRDGMHIEIHAVFTGDTFTLEDAARFHAMFGEHARVISEGNWARGNRLTRDFKPNEQCFRATRGINIIYDGRATACCFDPTGRLTFGDLKTQTLREVYASEKYVAFRQAHAEDRADEYEICKNCTRI